MIEYVFKMEDGAEFRFEVDLERKPAPAFATAQAAAWTSLLFQQCPLCPLPIRPMARCPAAVDIEQIAAKFRNIFSYTQATVEVRTPERTYLKKTDVQTGLRALVGLIMASSACPILSRFKALTHYHLPFATIEETLFRSASAYLLKQYFIHKDGGTPDLNLDGLNRLYQEIQQVNGAFKVRLETASQRDANLNAIVSLQFMSMAVSSSLDERLAELRTHFLQEFGGQ